MGPAVRLGIAQWRGGATERLKLVPFLDRYYSGTLKAMNRSYILQWLN